MNVMWFRRDLRVADNPALYHAVTSGPTIALFCVCDRQWSHHCMSERQKAALGHQLNALSNDLAKLNVPLLTVNAENFSQVPSAIAQLVKRLGVTQVLCNEEYEWNERQMSLSVERELQRSGIKYQGFHDQCLIAPGEILNQQGQPYKVFTAFKKAYLANLKEKQRPCFPIPKPVKEQKTLSIKSDLAALSCLPQWQGDQPITEVEAWQQLQSFCEEGLWRYHDERDFPALDGTSSLSTALAIGSLSVRQCWEETEQQQRQFYKRDATGLQTWRSELVWRDFYRHLIFLFPHLCRHKPFKANTDQLPWDNNAVLLTAWQRGQTGYPIVDAAMRQLNATGWMHNRLRMVVAMFLTKHLFLDWRLGEAYFMEQLVDGDLASNNGGWQWSASTGVDAVPYFRIFNPTRQSERFDATGLFIRQWVPELRGLDNKSIHMPTAAQAKKAGYPLPIVNHKDAVARTKLYFKSLEQPTQDLLQGDYGMGVTA